MFNCHKCIAIKTISIDFAHLSSTIMGLHSIVFLDSEQISDGAHSVFICLKHLYVAK